MNWGGASSDIDKKHSMFFRNTKEAAGLDYLALYSIDRSTYLSGKVRYWGSTGNNEKHPVSTAGISNNRWKYRPKLLAI